MNESSSSQKRTLPSLVRVLWVLVALTAIFSLLYGILYYLDGPLKLRTVSGFQALVLSPDKKLLVAGSDDGTLHFLVLPDRVRTEVTADFDVSKEAAWYRPTISYHTGPVIHAAFAPDYSALITTDGTGRVLAWDTSRVSSEGPGTIELIQDTRTGDSPLVAVDVSADGATLAAVAADGNLYLLNPQTGEEIRTIGPGEDSRHAVAVSSGTSGKSRRNCV